MTRKFCLKNAVIKYSDKIAINDVSLDAKSGEMIFITGANGSGKSTLTKGIAGLINLSSGSLERTQRMSYVPQFEEADRNFPAKVREIVITGRMRNGKFFYNNNDTEQANSAMMKLGIYELADREIKTLSGGQLRRVFLARALCGEPELLLLDEPCAGLDAESHKILFEAINKVLSNGCTVLMVTHDNSDLDGIKASRVITLSNGKIIDERNS